MALRVSVCADLNYNLTVIDLFFAKALDYIIQEIYWQSPYLSDLL